jgi:hypothetical protein
MQSVRSSSKGGPLRTSALSNKCWSAGTLLWPKSARKLAWKFTAGLNSRTLFALSRPTEDVKQAFDVLTCSDLGGLRPRTRGFHPFSKRLDDSKLVIWQRYSWNRLKARGATIRCCAVPVTVFRFFVKNTRSYTTTKCFQSRSIGRQRISQNALDRVTIWHGIKRPLILRF